MFSLFGIVCVRSVSFTIWDSLGLELLIMVVPRLRGPQGPTYEPPRTRASDHGMEAFVLFCFPFVFLFSVP